jgi:hypothetical protein
LKNWLKYFGLKTATCLQSRKEAMKMQKLGGYSAIASIILIIILLAIAIPFASRYGLLQQDAGLDPAKVAAAYSGSPMTVKVAVVIEIVLGILGLFVALALRERMQAKAPNLMRLLVIAASASCALTIINDMLSFRSLAAMAAAADVSIYKPFLVMQNGLSTASDNISGWVALLIGVAALSTRALPRFVGYVFLVIGILTVIGPALPSAGPAGLYILIVIGLFYAVATIWLGIVLLREREAGPEKA